MAIYAFDIDGTICTNTYGKYKEASPHIERIKVINSLYESGETIKLFTARGTTTGINWFEFTTKQMRLWGVKYHELILGKPEADFFIDDKGCNDNFWFWNNELKLLKEETLISNDFKNLSIALYHASIDYEFQNSINYLYSQINNKSNLERVSIIYDLNEEHLNLIIKEKIDQIFKKKIKVDSFLLNDHNTSKLFNLFFQKNKSNFLFLIKPKIRFSYWSKLLEKIKTHKIRNFIIKDDNFEFNLNKEFFNYINIPKVLNNERSSELFVELMVIIITEKYKKEYF